MSDEKERPQYSMGCLPPKPIWKHVCDKIPNEEVQEIGLSVRVCPYCGLSYGGKNVEAFEG